MKIIHVMGMRSQKFGGLEHFMVELSSQLKRQHHSLTVIYEEMPTNKSFMEQLARNDVRVIIRPCRGFKVLSFSAFFCRHLLRYRPDVVHVHFDPAGYVALMIASIFRVKRRIKTVHSMLGIESDSLSLKTKLLKRVMLFWSTNVFAVSNAIKKELETVFPCHHKIDTLYLGVVSDRITDDNLKIKYNIPDNKRIITCVAFHGYIKGVDILLRALHYLRFHLQYDGFLCLQIGGGNDDYSNYLNNLSKELNIDSHIRWMGIQNNVSEILAISDMCVQPSRSEGISLSLMEASMQALPIVAMNVGGIPEVVIDGENGFLIECEDYKALAEKIHLLCIDSDKIRIMGETGRDMALYSFDLVACVQKLIERYEE